MLCLYMRRKDTFLVPVTAAKHGVAANDDTRHGSKFFARIDGTKELGISYQTLSLYRHRSYVLIQHSDAIFDVGAFWALCFGQTHVVDDSGCGRINLGPLSFLSRERIWMIFGTRVLMYKWKERRGWVGRHGQCTKDFNLKNCLGKVVLFVTTNSKKPPRLSLMGVFIAIPSPKWTPTRNPWRWTVYTCPKKNSFSYSWRAITKSTYSFRKKSK